MKSTPIIENSDEELSNLLSNQDHEDNQNLPVNNNYRHNKKKKPEYAPLLQHDDSFDEARAEEAEEGKIGLTAVYKKRKSRLVAYCCLIFIFPLLIWIIFCSIYFSPVSLPTNVSPSLYQDVYKPSTTAPRLLTFNLFMRPPGIKNNANDYKDERLDYIIEHLLPSYDIITFQEAFAFANRRIDKLLTAAFDQGFFFHVDSPRHYPWDLAGDGGLLLLSRFPIKKADRIEFSRGVHADWLSYKGALHALIEIDASHHIHVYTTHTQASYDNGGEVNFADTKIRLDQFAHVHKFIHETASQDTWPILLMGDLNVNAAIAPNPASPDSPSYNSSLAYTMMMDVLSGKGTNLSLITNDSNTHEEQLTYASDWKLNLTDLPYKKFGYHPVTFGDYIKLSNGSFIAAETVLTSHNQLLSVQSIDRLLWSGNRKGHNANMSLQNITVQHFFVDKNLSLPFTQLSDHYGISAILNTK